MCSFCVLGMCNMICPRERVRRGTTQDERGLGLPLWSSEDYSTYSGSSAL